MVIQKPVSRLNDHFNLKVYISTSICRTFLDDISLKLLLFRAENKVLHGHFFCCFKDTLNLSEISFFQFICFKFKNAFLQRMLQRLIKGISRLNSSYFKQAAVFLKGQLLGLRQFLTIENPLKMMKIAFYLMLKTLFVLEIFSFLS